MKEDLDYLAFFVPSDPISGRSPSKFSLIVADTEEAEDACAEALRCRYTLGAGQTLQRDGQIS